MFDTTAFRVTLPAGDMERARAWYKEMLGLEPVEIDEFDGAWYETGGAQFLLYPSPVAGTNQATAASLTMDDFDGATALLRDRGVQFQEFDYDGMSTKQGVLELPDGRKGAWFTDSEGNILNIVSG